MSIFTVDQNKLTVTIHRDGCSQVNVEQLQKGKNGEDTAQENLLTFCENELDLSRITALMKGRYWILLLCEDCFHGSD